MSKAKQLIEAYLNEINVFDGRDALNDKKVGTTVSFDKDGKSFVYVKLKNGKWKMTYASSGPLSAGEIPPTLMSGRLTVKATNVKFSK